MESGMEMTRFRRPLRGLLRRLKARAVLLLALALLGAGVGVGFGGAGHPAGGDAPAAGPGANADAYAYAHAGTAGLLPPSPRPNQRFSPRPGAKHRGVRGGGGTCTPSPGAASATPTPWPTIRPIMPTIAVPTIGIRPPARPTIDLGQLLAPTRLGRPRLATPPPLALPTIDLTTLGTPPPRR